MKLVWHHPEMRQKDWIRFLFGDLVTSEIEDPEFACFDDDTIHVVSMIFRPLRAMEDYFAECRRRCDNLVLYHAGDEWFSGGSAPYKYFDNVVREMPSFFTRSEGVLSVPLGVPTKGAPAVEKPASQRRFVWSFAGEIRNTRIEMVKHFERIPYGNLIDTSTSQVLTPHEYDNVLRDTVFAPSGMGNIVTETWRTYEAIEAGAIPLLERRLTLDYYRALLGAHPIPTFGSWRRAAKFATTLMDDERALDDLQQEITAWWAGYKSNLLGQVAELLSRSHSAELRAFSEKAVNSKVAVHEPLRVLELLRHQSVGNLRRRSSDPVAPLRRIAAGLSRSDER